MALFPLYRPHRLRCQVVKHSVYVLHLFCDTLYYPSQQIIGYLFYGGAHGVHGIYRTDYHGICKAAFAVGRYTHGSEIRYCREILPHFTFKSRLCKFLSEDGIGLTDCFKSVAGNCSQAPYPKTGTRERLAVNHAVGKIKGLSHHTHLIFISLIRSAATTEESTPPDSARSTFLSPTCAFSFSTCSAMKLSASSGVSILFMSSLS